MLSVQSLNTDYKSAAGPVRAARNVTFTIPEGKLFTLLGPSGCGKTTTLRSIAGLERPTSGEIKVGTTIVYSSHRKLSVAPNRRNFGMVFQSYAIWPHMTVYENAAFPLRVRRGGPSSAQIKDRVTRVLDTVGLEPYAAREATRLSGGQQQRLALARALVMEPKLLLLDEPLSNLDAKLREKMRFELKRMQRDFGLTTLYVTHDQSEALALSHEIAVMNAGEIVQIGSPRDIYEHPRTRFVADFIGTTNFVTGKVTGADGECWRIDSEVGPLLVKSDATLRPGQPVTVSVRPEDVALTDPPATPAGHSGLVGTVTAKVFLGETIDFKVDVAGREILARAHPSMRTPVGQPIGVSIDPDKCIAIADDGTAPIAA